MHILAAAVVLAHRKHDAKWLAKMGVHHQITGAEGEWIIILVIAAVIVGALKLALSGSR